MYKVENEPSQRFSMLLSMDGNQSLKLVGNEFRSGSIRWDDRSARSPRWLTPEEVNVFKDEVKRTSSNVSLIYYIFLFLFAVDGTGSYSEYSGYR